MRRDLDGVPTSVPAARRFIAEQLVDAPQDVVDVAVLLVSELATNCVVHAATDFSVAITVTHGEARVEVTDHGPGTPAVAAPLPTNPHGRGLLIVDSLASAWGSESTPDGAKTTWFALAIRTR